MCRLQATPSIYLISGRPAAHLLDLPPLPDELAWSTNDFLTTGVLNVVSSGPDFNDDGIINGVDLSIWSQGFGSIDEPDQETGDADGDHDVDGFDFLAWQQWFGVGQSAMGGAAGVPELTALSPVSWYIVANALQRPREGENAALTF